MVTPDVLAVQQAIRNDSTRIFASVHTLAVLAVLSNLIPAPVPPKILRGHEHFFRSEP